MVRVVFSSAVQNATNGESERELEFEGSILELMQRLADIYGERFGSRLLQDGMPRRYVNIYVNGKDVRFLDGVETRVSGGDVVDLIPAVSGG